MATRVNSLSTNHASSIEFGYNMLVCGGFGPLGSTVQLIRKLLHSITNRMGKHDVTLDRMC